LTQLKDLLQIQKLEYIIFFLKAYMTSLSFPNVFEFDVRGISKRLRHSAIFGALESMEQGEIMRFINDHDPLPLLSQLQQRYQGQVRHQYQQNDAEKVVIDFSIHPRESVEETASSTQEKQTGAGGCGGGGGGCGCQGG
jgi:uncharacterized protein (DUF2249 family)